MPRSTNLKELINLEDYPIREVLDILLQDKTTKKNIYFATDSYLGHGSSYSPDSYITKETLLGLDSCDLQPRVAKALEEQAQRTRQKAEVFTPSWICNKMNNFCDEEWFGRSGVFNVEMEEGKNWQETKTQVTFPEGKDWKAYVDSKRLEITCGEAPYIASRYDTTTGEIIPIERRVGILDRKLRVVYENVNPMDVWLEWSRRAFESTYGYEFQGDNLLIARINLLMTYVDYHIAVFRKRPDVKRLREIANVIAWNFWQMDGLSGTVPYGGRPPEFQQMSLFGEAAGAEQETEPIPCKVMDWRRGSSILYNSMKKEN